MKSYQEFCTANATRLFDLINQHGSLLAWRREWSIGGAQQLPQGSNGLYKGGNLLSLFLAQISKGFKSNQWLTFNQVRALKGQVLKGAKSELVYFWAIKDKKTTDDKTSEEGLKKSTIFKTYHVFNLEQTTLFNQDQNSEIVYQCSKLLSAFNPEINHCGGRAFYSPSSDVINMPAPTQLTNLEAYEATLLHELTHWTGHKTRLDRLNTINYTTDKGRAEEELTAEIGAFFLATFFNIHSDIENHASYVNSWKQHLTEKEMMRATNSAAKAFHYLIEPLQVGTLDEAA